MEKLLDRIEEGFGQVCMEADPVSAYEGYHRMLVVESDNIDGLFLANAKESLLARRTDSADFLDSNNVTFCLDSARGHKFMGPDGVARPYLLGSGIVVVGDVKTGRLIAVDYRKGPEEVDPLEEHYGNYMHVAFRKAGQAALLNRLLMHESQSTLEEQLIALDLKSGADLPHHHGYASRGSLVAGASGMLPSPELAEAIEASFPEEKQRAVELGYLGPAGMLDFFAGLHDEEAARRVLRDLDMVRKEGKYLPLDASLTPTTGGLVDSFGHRLSVGHNPH